MGSADGNDLRIDMSLAHDRSIYGNTRQQRAGGLRRPAVNLSVAMVFNAVYYGTVGLIGLDAWLPRKRKIAQPA
jgi:hypothetical protein